MASFIALSASSRLAFAQAAAPSDATKLETVVVTASADASAGGLAQPYAGGQVARGGRVGLFGSQDIMDTPFSITNYTQQLIADQQAQSVGDVLQNDPAVRVARGFGNFQQVYMVRGLPVYSDDMAYNGLYGLLPRQYLAAEVLERVEVLRGASAFLNGAAP
ncbi:MAG TPA: Plug domain-containing protein, partial [Steroidobacteraceae bacterium]